MYMYNWKSRYNAFHAAYPGVNRTPVIAITGNFGDKGCELAEGYFESILRAGATPLILPPTDQPEALATALDHIDGLLLSGGADLNPLFVGEEPVPALGGINARRDLSELLLIRLAFDRQIPILGICRGIQMMAAALDGSIWQDLGGFYAQEAPSIEQVPNPIKHSQDLERSVASHSVKVAEGSLLHRIMGAETLYVNSFHHQAVRRPRLPTVSSKPSNHRSTRACLACSGILNASACGAMSR